MAQEVQISLSPKAILKNRLMYRLNFAAILNTPESEFAKLISEVERDEFFHKLFYPQNTSLKIISKKSFSNTCLSSSFYEMNEERLRSSSGEVDVERILANHKGMMDLIHKIGREKFELHFLYREESETSEQAGEACGLSPQEARELASLLLELSIQSEFFHVSSLPVSPDIHYTLAARIEIEKNKTVIHYLSPHMASGRYMIHHERLIDLKKTLSPDEKKKLKEVLSKIEWINLRQDTLHKILSAWGVRQNAYLRSGEICAQVPYTQKDLSRELHLAPSTVSRCIVGKSIVLPWGNEFPLKDLFFSKKETAIHRIQKILSDLSELERNKISDEHLNRMLFEKYRLKSSRRSVNLYRRAAESNES